MPNVFDYLAWRGDLTFAQSPFNEADSLILCRLAYIPFDGIAPASFVQTIPLADAAARCLHGAPPQSAIPLPAEAGAPQEGSAEPPRRFRLADDARLLAVLATSRRFCNARLSGYVNLFDPAAEKQFSALTILLEGELPYVAFRGTDGTLVGWKEDFNMAFQEAVPAQLLAQDYVREVAAEYVMPLRLGGHSKGGNLAVFAAARSTPDIQQRILEVYNNDGPGFTDYLMGDPGYLAMVPRIKTYVPQSSVIGMLLEHEEPYTIIKSNQVSVLQHDPYSWEVMGPNFVPMQSITADSQFVNQTIKAWIASMDTQERNRLVDALFGLLGTGGIDKALDIFHPRNIRTYIKTLGNDPETRQILSAEFQNLMEAAKRTRIQPGDAKTLPEGK